MIHALKAMPVLAALFTGCVDPGSHATQDQSIDTSESREAAALGSAAPDDAPTRVDDLLAGWRSETIEFPPAFAPTLPRGVETLRFAPDTFVEDSETLWTYCFAAEVEGDWTEPDDLAAFFRTYFDGLIPLVAGGDGVSDPPPAEVSFVRRPDGSVEGTARILDGFVSLELMRLNIRVSTTFAGGWTDLRVRATPRPFDDPIWRTLADEVARIELPPRTE